MAAASEVCFVASSDWPVGLVWFALHEKVSVIWVTGSKS